jgi:hypothetical protein
MTDTRNNHQPPIINPKIRGFPSLPHDRFGFVWEKLFLVFRFHFIKRKQEEMCSTFFSKNEKIQFPTTNDRGFRTGWIELPGENGSLHDSRMFILSKTP